MTLDELVLERWSVYGNQLLFLDALTSTSPPERELPVVAQRALDATGADSLILIQNCERSILAAINEAWGYWEVQPASTPDIMIRIFEPDGSESLSCGNGLLSAASLLLERGIPLPALTLTGIPDNAPWTVEVGTDRSGRAWLKSDRPRRVSSKLAATEPRGAVCSVLDRFGGIAPPDGQGLVFPPRLAGYLVLTGEPHLVVLAREWAGAVPDDAAGQGRWLSALGHHLNRQCRDLFPKGVNVDLVLGGTPEQGLRYRCFERGVNRETGACGTGAMAVAYTWREMACENCDEIRVHPWGADNGGYLVRWTDGGMRLCGKPLFQGRVG